MNDMNDNPFERQVADVARRTVGPPREVDALGIARQAAMPDRSWGWRSTFGVLRFLAGGLVVAVFGALLLLSGALEVNQDEEPAIVGSSPSTSGEPSPSARADALPSGAPDATPTEFASEEVTHATGTFDEKFGSHLSQDVPGYSVTLRGPRWFDVRSSDPRLAGEATLLAIEGGSESGSGLSVYYGRMEIKNADGVWSGTVGPLVQANAVASGDGAEADEAAATSSEFERFGPTVLAGSEAYEGFTAYIHLPHHSPSPLEAENPDWFEEGSGMEGPFEAVVVNRAIPGFPSDEQWLAEMRRTGQSE